VYSLLFNLVDKNTIFIRFGS